jgi:hypothetical protein
MKMKNEKINSKRPKKSENIKIEWTEAKLSVTE